MSYTYFLNFIYARLTKFVNLALIPFTFFISIFLVIISEYTLAFFSITLFFSLFIFFSHMYFLSPFTLKEFIFPPHKRKFYTFSFIQKMTLGEHILHVEKFIQYINENFKSDEKIRDFIKIMYFNYLIKQYSYESIFILKKQPLTIKKDNNFYYNYHTNNSYEDFFDVLMLHIEDNEKLSISDNVLIEIVGDKDYFDEYYLKILISKKDTFINENILNLCKEYNPELLIKAEQLILNEEVANF